MATQIRTRLSEYISDACDQAGCNDNVRKLHHAQFVDRRWNPHPPRSFVNWWGANGASDAEKQTTRAWVGIDAVRAFNCESVRKIFSEIKQYGL